MSVKSENLDLNFWLDREFLQKHNRLKAEFWEILGTVGDSVSLEEISKTHPRPKGKKLSRGNDLLGFPYQVLDLIRDFDLSGGLNIRVLNWFGHGMFLFVLIGKKTFSEPSLTFLENNFSLGLTSSPWDYPELILESNSTSSPSLNQLKDLAFFQWFKPIPIPSDKDLIVGLLSTEIKKVVDSLTQKMG
ncbi:MAG: hypothetical protein PSV36_09215 [Algoriphagus sp.]|nr:hypothetical protein [Algoriphagus sp.]